MELNLENTFGKPAENDLELNKLTEAKENSSPLGSDNTLEAKASEEENSKSEEEPKEEAPPPPPVDASVEIEVSSDRMKAYISVSPAQNGGKDITIEKIKDAISKAGVVVGINEEHVALSAMPQTYGKLITIAEGIPAVDGIPGVIEHFYDLSRKNQPKVNKDGSVDYKNTGLITNIMEEKPICQMTLPIPSVDGQNVLGEAVHGKDAPALKIPKGKNTYITEDQTLLLSQKRGNLKLENGVYVVEETITINGDVDISVGDIKFVGKVEVMGNVREGYSVKSETDIMVRGMVEGAVLEAKGNLDLRGGISGMGMGKISCKGDLKTKFIENAEISVGGNLETDYILNSNISCNGQIKCMGKKGLIVGGSCSAMDSIEAKSIGNDNGTKTNVTVGVTGEYAEKRAKLTQDISDAKLERDKCDKDLQYLSFKEKAGNLTDERKEVFKKLKARLPMLETKLKILNAEQDKIQAILEGGQKSKITCHGRVYPGVNLTVASVTLNVAQTIPRGKFMLIDGEIKTLD